MKTIKPHEPQRLERRSSISQYSNMLAVRRGDEWVPVVFDVLDNIVCKKINTHKAMLATAPYVGYHFPVGEARYVNEQLVLSDQKGEEIRLLPEFFGSGFYKAKFDRDIIVNAANGALGEVNDVTLRVGLDYVLSDDFMEPKLLDKDRRVC